MEATSIAIEIDGEAICLDNDGETGEISQNDNGEAQTVIYDGENAEQEASGSQEHGREHDPVKDTDDKEKYAPVSSREELTEELQNKVAYSEEEAYRLYCDYGHRMGFSVRKGKQYYFTGTKTIRTKDYYCSKEGLKDDEQLTEANFNRPETRTNCKAMVRFRVDSEGQWKVIQIIPEHNHELVRPEERHLLRSVRSLSIPKPGVLNAMVNAEIQAIHTCLHVNEGDAGSGNQFGLQNNAQIDPEDIQGIVRHFRSRTIQEGMFYWDVQIDQKGRITNFFWRDGKSRIDYDCFGDVVVFDTTYRKNKYNVTCAPFVGVNHHWQNIMLGCAFLSDESLASYQWLFKSFLVSMGGHPPKTIFTDQNEVISKAIEEVFPETRHCLCQWHIEKNLQSHLGTLNACRTFHNMFTKCMNDCDSEAEFEETWAMMLHEYNLQDHQWLTDLYQLRHKWCTALQKDAFDGGIKSLDRRESSNNVLNSIAEESTCLTKFVLEFDNLVKSWRENESIEDIRSDQTAPECAIKHSNILRHAAELYTHKIYKSFEAGFLDGCGATSYQEMQCSDTLYRFEFMQGRGPKVWIVLLDTSTVELTCSCKKFETMGILCSHALNTLSLKNVDRIPQRYVLRRWTKYVRKGIYAPQLDELSQQDCLEAELAYRNRAMRFFYDLLMKSKGHQDSRKVVLDVLESGEKALENVCESKRLHVHSSVRDKDGNKSEKRKKKSLKQEKSSRSVKQAVLPAPADSLFVPPSSENRYYSTEDIPCNQSIGRPFYYQGYPTTGATTSQIPGHTNMPSIPHCASQEYSAYGVVHPPPSTFGGGRNF